MSDGCCLFLLTWQWWASTLAGALVGSAIVVIPILYFGRRK